MALSWRCVYDLENNGNVLSAPDLGEDIDLSYTNQAATPRILSTRQGILGKCCV